MTSSMNEQRVVDAVYLSSSAAFDTVSSNILIDWSGQWGGSKADFIAGLEGMWSALQRSAGGQ